MLTTFRFIGKNDRVCVSAFDDPKVPGVACYVSQARTGGISGTIGLARRPLAVLDRLPANRPDGEQVYSARTSIFFKRTHVYRMLDKKRNTLVYLAISDKLIEGSPQNSISTVRSCRGEERARLSVIQSHACLRTTARPKSSSPTRLATTATKCCEGRPFVGLSLAGF